MPLRVQAKLYSISTALTLVEISHLTDLFAAVNLLVLLCLRSPSP